MQRKRDYIWFSVAAFFDGMYDEFEYKGVPGDVIAPKQRGGSEEEVAGISCGENALHGVLDGDVGGDLRNS